MTDLKRLFKFMKPHRFHLFLAIFFVTTETLFELIIPMLMADIIDVGVAAQDLQFISIRGLQMIGCAILSLILGLLYARYAALAAQGFGSELRKAQFRKIQEYSFSNLDHFDTSSLITRMTSDVNVIQNAINSGLRPIVRGPVMLIMGLVIAFYINATLALVFVICIPILALILYAIVRKVSPMYKHLQHAIDKLNSMVQENLQAIRVVKAFVRQDYEEIKFQEVNADLMSVSERTFHYAVMNMPAFQFIMYTAIVLIIWYGGQLIFVGGMMVGELTGFLSYVLQIMNSLMMISSVFLMLTRSLASATRIIEIFDEPLNLIDCEQANETITHGNIDFNHVYFKYREEAKEYVLSDIDLHIKSGQTIGIIGGTGSAKSTLVQLIPRLYDCSKGSLFIDGKDITSFSLHHLRDSVGMVLQKNILFSGTIRENLLWGNQNASDKDMKWACDIACADEFINAMPKGYDTDLGQGGVNVSGGQKQRICIARALLKHPKVLIFDDSTSAVDTTTEASIRNGLASLKDTTKIIIAQRISSIMHADQIVILEDGHIHAIGNHESLLKDNEIYQDIYTSQQEGGMK